MSSLKSTATRTTSGLSADLVAAAQYWADLESAGGSPENTVLSTKSQAGVLAGQRALFTGSGKGLLPGAGSGVGNETFPPGRAGRNSSSFPRRSPLVSQGSGSSGSDGGGFGGGGAKGNNMPEYIPLGSASGARFTSIPELDDATSAFTSAVDCHVSILVGESQGLKGANTDAAPEEFVDRAAAGKSGPSKLDSTSPESGVDHEELSG